MILHNFIINQLKVVNRGRYDIGCFSSFFNSCNKELQICGVVLNWTSIRIMTS